MAREFSGNADELPDVALAARGEASRMTSSRLMVKFLTRPIASGDARVPRACTCLRTSSRSTVDLTCMPISSPVPVLMPVHHRRRCQRRRGFPLWRANPAPCLCSKPPREGVVQWPTIATVHSAHHGVIMPSRHSKA